MITGGSSSGVAIAVQGLCQEAGVIFMAGLTHSNDTTGKDKRANGFRHFFNTEMTGAALAPVLKNNYGTDRKALPPDRRLHLGLVAGRLDQEVHRSRSAGKPLRPSAPRSAPATSRSTSRRFSTPAPTCWF
jgi:hypothetical protein